MATVLANINNIIVIIRPIICVYRIHITHLRRYSDLKPLKQKINRKSTTNEVLYETFKISKDNILERLQTLLCINKVKAIEIVTNCKHFNKVSPKLLTDNYEVCKIYGITNESLISCPELLTQKDLPEKIHLINSATNDVNSMISLLKMNFNNLSKTVNLLDQETDRVTYFSKLFNVKPLQICEYIKKKPFLLKLNLERIQESIRLLKDNGISQNEILSDLWVLNYKTDTVEKRIKFVKENNFEKIKTWMIRAPSDIILNYIKIRSDNKQILGNNSLAEYLSQRLECNVEQANYIISRVPALKGKSVKKMNEIIDYLYSLGIKPIHICITPKILLHSVETMKKRVEELQEQGVYIDNLRLLTKSQKQYQVYYNKLIITNKKKLRGIK